MKLVKWDSNYLDQGDSPPIPGMGLERMSIKSGLVRCRLGNFGFIKYLAY